MAIELKNLYDINNNNINPEYSVYVNTVIVIATAITVMCNMNNNDTKWPLKNYTKTSGAKVIDVNKDIVIILKTFLPRAPVPIAATVN